MSTGKYLATPTGVELIEAERERQVDEEGWTSDHDAGHTEKEIALAAISYLSKYAGVTTNAWPWDISWFKPSSDVSNLVKAGALIAAEIDRLLATKEIDKKQKMYKLNDLAEESFLSKSADEITRIERLVSNLIKTYNKYGIDAVIHLDARQDDQSTDWVDNSWCVIAYDSNGEDLLHVVSSSPEDAIKTCQLHATIRATKIERLDECLNPDDDTCGDCVWCDSFKHHLVW